MKFPEQFRWKDASHGYDTKPGDPFGAFIVFCSMTRRTLNVIATDGDDTDWEHISVSIAQAPKQCPRWDEMCFVKSLFWDENETVVQFHPADDDYVNFHQGTLHLWRYRGGPFPMPPKICV
jgi:hypothetical protein